MALFFAESAAAAMAGESVVMTLLARFDFPAGERRYWIGHGDVALAGEVWQGMGEFVSVSGLTRALNDAAVPLTFTLSGVDDAVVALANTESGALPGRAVTVYLQPFAADATPLDSPVAIWTGSMDRLEFEGDAEKQSLALVCEGLFSNRSRAAYALMTDINQQHLHPGDLFFEHAASLIEKRISWP